jgi:hypothetical protein
LYGIEVTHADRFIVDQWDLDLLETMADSDTPGRSAKRPGNGRRFLLRHWAAGDGLGAYGTQPP